VITLSFASQYRWVEDKHVLQNIAGSNDQIQPGQKLFKSFASTKFKSTR